MTKRMNRLSFCAHRPQQKCRQMSAIIGMRGVVRWPACMPRTRLIEASDRRGLALVSRRPLVSLPAATTAVFALAVLTRFRALVAGCLRLSAHPGNRLPDQLLDRRHV